MNNFTDVISFEQRAKEALPQEAFNYFAGGCGEELTLFDNVSAYDSTNYKGMKIKSTTKSNLFQNREDGYKLFLLLALLSYMNIF